MGTVRHRLLLATALLSSLLGAASSARADEDDPGARAGRWQALQQALFPGRSLKDGAGVVKLDAPPRALDAALVPIGVDLTDVKPIKSVYLVIDGNPSPLAAHFTFGPKADPHSLKLRVRVDRYTDIHAIAESQDGQLFVTSRFVKASGGCSAPAGADGSSSPIRSSGRPLTGRPRPVTDTARTARWLTPRSRRSIRTGGPGTGPGPPVNPTRRSPPSSSTRLAARRLAAVWPRRRRSCSARPS